MDTRLSSQIEEVQLNAMVAQNTCLTLNRVPNPNMAASTAFGELVLGADPTSV